MVLTTKSVTKKSRFNKALSRQEKIVLNQKLADKARDLVEYFDIAYADYASYISMTCPIHEGADNPSAFSICTDPDDEMYGLWRCWTRGCEKSHSHDMLGLVQALMQSSEKYKNKSKFPQVIKFAVKFVETSAEDLKEASKDEKYSVFDKFTKAVERKSKKSSTNISREDVRKSLTRPASYYINRGFDQNILDKFDVGVCLDRNKPMYNRVVAPVYDDDFSYMVGCVGRVQNEDYNGRKWINSKHFHTGSYLYGYWLAKEKIRETKTVILVEGQGDVWRLHEAGLENSVGIFGSSLSDSQCRTLETSGAFNLVILTDNDEAGKKARNSIKDKCSRIFNIIEPEYSHKDVGDMTVEQIETEIKPQLKGFS